METLVGWILVGVSGSVVGLAGAGKSNLLGFWCHRPGVLQSYFPSQADPVVLVPVRIQPANHTWLANCCYLGGG
jgi:hypothetical protein